jgi:Undecaprenyl-phosphate galactose phosphotransferase WbaP
VFPTHFIKQLDAEHALAATPAVREVRHRQYWAAATVMGLDIGGLTVSFGASSLAWSALSGRPVGVSWALFMITIAIFVAICGVEDLYKLAGVSPVEELRRIVLAIAGTWLLLTFITFVLKDSSNYSRGMLILASCFAVILIPLSRLIGRPMLGRQPWFAEPIAILGAGATAAALIEVLRSNPGLALRPVVLFDDNPDKCGALEGVPVVGGISEASSYCGSMNIHYAVVAMPGLSRVRLLDVIRSTKASFSRLLVVPDLFGVASVWVEARDLGGMLGLEIRDNLLRPSSLFAKRLVDLALIIMALPVLVPLCAAVAVLVKVDSAGPVFYSQRRIGRLGKVIRVWKFRTMRVDAEQVLRQCLTEHPNLQVEWSKDRKLKNDPRITRVGRWFRRSSLDELPQLWNVLKGEMSLVGPRPIVSAEIEKFGRSYEAYTRVPPGITGPWQVSGRNGLSYDERIRLNEHYVQNWSIWLDLFILFKTVRVVLMSDGAY